MKVLMTADAVGGVWTYALELCEALARHGVSVVLATMGPLPSETQRQQVSRIPHLRLETSQYKLEWMSDPWSEVTHAGEWLLQLAQREQPELIHLNGYTHSQLPWGRPVLVVAHSCVFSWWEAVHGTVPPPAWDRYRSGVEQGLQSATAIVAPTDAFLRTLERHYRFDTPRRVIRNARSTVRQDRRLQPKDRIIFACGRAWDEAKNIHVLDQAARDLPWRVEVAGSTESPDGRRYQSTHIHLLGRRAPLEIADSVQRAGIFVHPARYEPFGLSVLEAAQAACALVLSDIPTLRECWSDAAVFVDTRDAVALHRALLSLIEDEPRRAALGERARMRATQFSPETMAREYVVLYEELAAQLMTERSVA